MEDDEDSAGGDAGATFSSKTERDSGLKLLRTKDGDDRVEGARMMSNREVEDIDFSLLDESDKDDCCDDCRERFALSLSSITEYFNLCIKFNLTLS
jgi:hypothetical protein